MTKDEALDLALEALEESHPEAYRHVITAIKQARALDKKAENARELGLDYEMPITMQEGEFDCTHAERLCAELKAAHPVAPCTHPSLGACSLREDGTASRWNCVMCGTEFVPKATNRWAEFNEATKQNIKHAEWYLSTHPQPAQQEPVAWMDRDGDLYANEPDKNWCPPHYPLYTTPPAAQPAPDLQAELEATNRQVEILSDALAESRREVAQLKSQPAPLQEPLTDEHIERIYHRYGGNMINCARAIERAVFAAQRQWVGLTPEEIDTVYRNLPPPVQHWQLARTIEAKLKEKNT